MSTEGSHPKVVVNDATGERVTFESETPELLSMLVEWPRPGRRGAEHIHPGMTETWHVIEGTAGFRVDGVEVQGGPGTSVVAPAGRRHLAWNAGDDPVRLRIEMRPALRWREFTTRFFGGENPVALLAEFADEIVLPPRPDTP